MSETLREGLEARLEERIAVVAWLEARGYTQAAIDVRDGRHVNALGTGRPQETAERFGWRPVWVDAWAGEAHRVGEPLRSRMWAPDLHVGPGADLRLTFRGGDRYDGPILQVVGPVQLADEATARSYAEEDDAREELRNRAARVRLEARKAGAR